MITQTTSHLSSLVLVRYTIGGVRGEYVPFRWLLTHGDRGRLLPSSHPKGILFFSKVDAPHRSHLPTEKETDETVRRC